MAIYTCTTTELAKQDQAFVCQGKRFGMEEKVYDYLRSSSLFDVIKIEEEARSYFLRRTETGFEEYATQGNLRKALSRETGGAWVELSGKKVRYLMDKGWIFSHIQKVSKEEYLSKLGPQVAKATGIILGILALAPAGAELGKLLGEKQVATGLALYKYPALGFALTMMSKVDAQTIGTEFQVNTNTYKDQKSPFVAFLRDGGFIVAWCSTGDETPITNAGNSYGIMAKRYGPENGAIGDEFFVNTYTTRDQLYPSIASLNNGGFVVVWQSDYQDGSDWGIFGQRFGVDGAFDGGEFRINSYTTDAQKNPSVASLNDGGFVVVWESDWQDESFLGIFGKRYDDSGVVIGTEFQVNTYTESRQWFSSVASLSDGGFIVVWSTQAGTLDRDSYGISGQRYDIFGNEVEGEFLINSYTQDTQEEPSVASFKSGGFVVTWDSLEQDGYLLGVFGQRYDSSGKKTGPEFQVNTYTDFNQNRPAVAALADEGFVVTWQSENQDGDSYGVFGQRYGMGGSATGTEFQINTLTQSFQGYQSIASLDDGGFVVVWQSTSIFWLIYDANGTAILVQSPTPTPTPTHTPSPTPTPTPSPTPVPTPSLTPSPTPVSALITTPTYSSTISSMLRPGASSNLKSPNSSEQEPDLTWLWVTLGALGGVVCTCVGGGTFLFLQKQKNNKKYTELAQFGDGADKKKLVDSD
ncbi:MAG: hypothetical protein K940chlam9_01734 [Chlamydiae bacterium]|nr:hypothetical protein [Chlamydiota bacterium]